MTAETAEPAERPARRRRVKGVESEELQRRYPTLRALTGPPGRASRGAWIATFNARPDAMHSLLADFIKHAHARPGRIGQRPMPREEQVDFNALIYGETTDLPLIEAIPELLKTLPRAIRTQRGFAARLHMSRSTWDRIMRGAYEPNVNELRQIAEAFGKPPTYFPEYRKAMAVAAFVDLLDRQPGIATSLYRRYLSVRMPVSSA